MLERSIAELGIYPAVDPLASTSRILDQAIVGEEHYNVARSVQRILQRYKDLQDIIAILGMDILTPEKSVFEGQVEYVEVPGIAVYLGVLAHHAALVTGLAKGALTVRDAAGRTERWQVEGGFFEVSHNRATVLADAVEGTKG